MNRILTIFFSITILVSCKENSKKTDKFLKINYNYLRDNVKEKYSNYKVRIIESSSNIDTVRLNKIDSLYEHLILKLDKQFNTENNPKNSLQNYLKVKNEINKIVENNKKFILDKSISSENDFKTSNGNYRAKTEIIASFDKAINYTTIQRVTWCGFYPDSLKIDYSINNSSIKKLIFSDFYVQKNYGKTEIFIDKITKGGKIVHKNIKGEHNNYSFYSLNVNNLQKGTYKIKGKVRYYGKYGNLEDLAFEKEFQVE